MRSALALLLAAPLAAQISINLVPGGTNEKISLVSKSGPVEIAPAAYHHTKTVSLFGVKFTAWMKPSEKPVEASPTVINFGKIRPTKGRNTLLVKLIKDGDLFKVVLKEGMSGYSHSDEAMPFASKKYPDPVKGADGIWTLTLPEPLAPGDYALVSDLENWQFTVSAQK